MKFNSILSLSLSALFASSAGLVSAANPLERLFIQNGGLKIQEDKKIPGDSPISLCDAELSQLIEIDNITIDPNPPVRGSTLNILASGLLKQNIEEGAYVEVEVKYGYIKLVHDTIDLCEQLGNVNMTCPVEAGQIDLSKSVDLPNEIPPGKYSVVARAYTVDDELLTCLTAQVEFPIDKRV
ncbi:Npc2p [Sugiyamaella lignohabitans]|uniref:Phosphatidylglycerol/phosphatidylinositol transfer protein n=1 Tax=Sugiyamaella lignohabitans TaxID=796027 RepID=A0A167E3U0_9ASCO|nr:Npc2p [Sugiyamaella lignohabitans]ANB13608.1 Npc2p [Sugiyamaella lignohabitans]